MQRVVAQALLKTLRALSLVVLAVVGTTILMQLAPGFFTDAREMDGRYTAAARSEIAARKQESGSVAQSLAHLFRGWGRGDLGLSAQFGIPVMQLMKERLAITAKLVLNALLLGWTVALSLALVFSARRRNKGERIIALLTAGLLCVPVAVMATVCLTLDHGGPVVVLGSLIAIRDFKWTYRLFRSTVKAPQLLYARAQGFSFRRTVGVHLFYMLRGELLALTMMSFVVAISAAVPVEVIFDRPGLGQLAWSAAMNRDLPVLASVTFLMACLVAAAGALTDRAAGRGRSFCA